MIESGVPFKSRREKRGRHKVQVGLANLRDSIALEVWTAANSNHVSLLCCYYLPVPSPDFKVACEAFARDYRNLIWAHSRPISEEDE